MMPCGCSPNRCEHPGAQNCAHPEIYADAVAYVMERSAIVPGSCWRHHTSGAIYVVLMISNDYPPSEQRAAYPVNVIYANAATGRVHNGPIDDWNRRMSLVDFDPAFLMAPAKSLINASLALLDAGK